VATVSVARDRAQLILVGALALAVTLVAIALVLNSAIYTHNLASRYQSPADSSATFARDARIGAGGLLDHANDESSNYGGISGLYVLALEDYEESSARVVAPNGRSISFDHQSHVRGVRVIDDTSGEFDPRTHDPTNWTVASEVRIRQFNVTVDDVDVSQSNSTTDDQLSSPAEPGAFFVTVEDDSGTARYVAVYNDSTGTPLVMVHNGSSPLGVCSTGSFPAELDLTGERFGGTTCPALGAIGDLSGPRAVRFNQSNDVTGTYGLTADLRINDGATGRDAFNDTVDTANYGSHCSGPTYHPPGISGTPRVSPAWYSADLIVNHSDSDVAVGSTQRVASGEPGQAPKSPRITRIDVTDNVGSSANFDVTVEVTDPDDNLKNVTLALLDSGGSERDSDEDSSISGTSGTANLGVTDGSNGTFTLVVTAWDVDENERTVEQEHESNDDTTGCPA
jgi:hypothetical protein